MDFSNLYIHQKETVEFLRLKPRVYIGSTAGTGKTVCIINDIHNRLNANPMSKTLILSPKSLVDTVWSREFMQWTPHIKTSVALAPEAKRIEAFNEPANVYITNIDALKWLSMRPNSFWNNFETIIIDESTAIKNDSARTKAALKIRHNFKYRRCLSGTPTAGSLTDLFYQYLFLDDGQHLGNIFGRFRNMVMIKKQVGPHPRMVKWSNKPGREKVLAKLLQNITVRYVLEDVVDMPPVVKYTYSYTPNKAVMTAYKAMKANASIQLKTGTVNAINASALTTKLLQIASGAVKNTETGISHLVDLQRYELVLDICDDVEHAVVFYNWKSQRDYFLQQSLKRGLSVTHIDGDVKAKDRKTRVADFQDGKYDIIFLQLKSSSHGLTLTKASHTIWSCPSYLADYYSQGNNRVFRIGQTKRTCVINIEAKNTLDEKVYGMLDNKLNAMELLTDELK